MNYTNYKQAIQTKTKHVMKQIHQKNKECKNHKYFFFG
ncbi:Hypothetical Protein SLY_0804 [Strawberry lethal yellows phytoplasma (CPA) str. NZSb11]|uniref:Uncharacterized protein n=1 Tax=Strawberry lethal yellows phytoplasma (CPA) str. NZSb11 TaxID=980422 RepID=R4S1M5_PHYAS|nr:Hypothetical Protein SLY_0804 [Strawberry lethal yellows phytoplasma (CPA) str. NZSb11]